MKNYFQAPLNGQILGGNLTWLGDLDADWSPVDVCVDWESNNFPWVCGLTKVGKNTWELVKSGSEQPGDRHCQALPLYTSCIEYYSDFIATIDIHDSE